MHIGIPQRTWVDETRTVVTLETVRKYIALSHQVTVQSGVGVTVARPDEAYIAAGARIGTAAGTPGVRIVFKARSSETVELAQMQPDVMLVGMLSPFDDENTTRLATASVTALALEVASHAMRAQSMDVLFSQVNTAGCKAVIVVVNHYQRFTPMLMTVVGIIKAARVLVLNAGVAGLQAIAIAKRLGAVIETSDVCPATKEQIESLSAKFFDVSFLTDGEHEITQGMSSCAWPMPPDWMCRQAELAHARVSQADIVITTALIPGHRAPTLLSEATVQAMKPGFVVVDLAAVQGGNCPLTEADRVAAKHGVMLVGYTSLALMVAADISVFYARNALDFLKLIIDKGGGLNINHEDDIVAACLLSQAGQMVRAPVAISAAK